METMRERVRELVTDSERRREVKIRRRTLYDWQLPKWGRYRYFGERQRYYCLGPIVIEGPDFEWK